MTTPQRRTILGLHTIALALWGFHLYVYTLPPTPTAIPEPGSAEAALWGFWPITYLPAWCVGVATVAVMGTVIVAWLALLRPALPLPSLALLGSTPTLAILSILLFAAFFSFPIVHTRWGDAYILSNAIAWPDPALRLTHSWQAPLDVFVHSQLWLWLHERSGWASGLTAGWTAGWTDAMPVYRILSPLAGMLYLGVVLALSHNGVHSPKGEKDAAPGWLIFGLLASLGLLQLFFGYVENYSFATAGVLAYLWLALGVLRGERPLWLAATVLAVTHATHPSTIALAPSLLYCGWRWMQHQPGGAAWRAAAQIALPMGTVAALTILLMEAGGHGIEALLTSDQPGGSDARLFVPLFTTTTRWEHYTLFSLAHLRDFWNEQMLVAPVVLVTLLWIGWQRNAWRREPAPFLLVASLCYLLFTWVWNPDYGGQRDWDLFSLAALPITLLLITQLPRVLPARRQLAAGALPLILVQALHTTAWIYQNTLPWEWP